MSSVSYLGCSSTDYLSEQKQLPKRALWNCSLETNVIFIAHPKICQRGAQMK